MKKCNLLLLLAIVFICIMTLLFVACDEKIYTINYHLDGGTTSNPISVSAKSNIVLDSATKENCRFEGWYLDSSYTMQVYSLNNVKSDMNIFAKFNPLYNVTYVTNGGIIASPAVQICENDRLTLPIPTKENYLFDGWYTEPNFFTEITELYGVKTDTAVYAKFIPIHTIDYELNGGIVEGTLVKLFTEKDNVILPEPTKDGYMFDGWYKDAEFTERVVSIRGLKESILLFAKFIPVYTISYDLDGGHYNGDLVAYYTSKSDTFLPIPDKKGYEFLYWIDQNGEKLNVLQTGESGNKSLKAVWARKRYSITWQLGGGYINELLPSSYMYGDIMADEFAFPKSHTKVFCGWYDENDNYKSGLKGNEIGDLVLTAKWTEPTRTVLTNAWSASGSVQKYRNNDSSPNINIVVADNVNAWSIDVPPELADIRTSGKLHARAVVNFSIKARTAGSATVWNRAYLYTNGQQLYAGTASATGNGYGDIKITYGFTKEPLYGSWAAVNVSVSTNDFSLLPNTNYTLGYRYTYETNQKNIYVIAYYEFLCSSVVCTYSLY